MEVGRGLTNSHSLCAEKLEESANISSGAGNIFRDIVAFLNGMR